ncbi:MAG: alpha/beta fold hydrolase [Rubrobacteraceae bacterium]
MVLRGTNDYRIERWFASGIPLVSVRLAGAVGPLPAVVIFHRFSGKKTDDILHLALPLADSGCVAVLPDAALHGDRAPHDFDLRLEHDRDSLFMDVLKGTVRESSEVLDWLAEREEIDAARIGMVGTSMGGAVALAVACHKHTPAPKVAVALMPTTSGPGSSIRQEAAYTPEAEQCFPTALMIIHGTENHITPYPNARSFYDSLVPRYSAAPERLRFVDMPSEDHRVGAYCIEETLSWLERFL